MSLSTYSTADFKRDVRAGKYTSIGCYPVFFLCSDGGVLCPTCARKEAKQIIGAILDGDSSGWRVVAHDANWEDPELMCDHCNERIESAYAEDDTHGCDCDNGESCDQCNPDEGSDLILAMEGE